MPPLRSTLPPSPPPQGRPVIAADPLPPTRALFSLRPGRPAGIQRCAATQLGGGSMCGVAVPSLRASISDPFLPCRWATLPPFPWRSQAMLSGCRPVLSSPYCQDTSVRSQTSTSPRHVSKRSCRMNPAIRLR
ncbi:hypothetical protein ACP70R_033214 [Stipagrostis hirtigluma subsp. patula]